MLEDADLTTDQMTQLTMEAASIAKFFRLPALETYFCSDILSYLQLYL